MTIVSVLMYTALFVNGDNKHAIMEINKYGTTDNHS